MNNFYEPERLIYDAVKDNFVEPLMFSQDTVGAMTEKTLAKIDKDDRLACFIEFKGYHIGEEDRSDSSTINSEWRVYVVGATELYNTRIGGTLVKVVRDILADGSNGCCSPFKLMNDRHQFHEPTFDESLCYLYVTFKHEGIIEYKQT